MKYLYRCTPCKKEFEIEKSIFDDGKKPCPRCKSLETHRVITAITVIYKTNGFYSKDNRKK